MPEISDLNKDNKEEQLFAGYLAEIVEVKQSTKTGIYGEIYIVSCRILEGRDKGRIIRRNMLGPVKKGDVVRLPDTSREARDIRVK
ncbi:MAG: 30S ribosomal protein S28e [Candidatus Marsarchaeota archaeon]|jgi:small subunit ribosomal protein S28e|nr:30S ribosomal protein S28e [Candidatus Marsarchaeota archaeon]